MGVDQSHMFHDDPLRLPRLLEARGSLPSLSTEGGESNRRRVNSFSPDKLSHELSPRKDALKHRIASPSLSEKQTHPLSIGNEWLSEPSSNADLPEGEVERKESPRADDNSPFWWYSDDDDNNDEFDEASNTFVTKMKEKKVHSMDEIKNTSYLRMKSPEHWLPKMGKVPISLLS